MNEPAEDSNVAPDSSVDSRDATRYPVNYVLGVIANGDAAVAALNDLTRRGFLDSEIGVTCGQAAAEALNATTGRRGLADIAMRIGEWMGVSNDEMTIKESYEQALRSGQFIVGALAPDDERKRIASEIIVSHGGHFVHYFNRFSIERLQK